jgi:phosphoesterase RecJ-like protein
MKKVIDHLKTCKNILLVTHAEPDGDALGSLIALGVVLEQANKTITMYNEDPTPAIYRFLPSSNRIVHELDDISRYDTAVILDCSSLDRVGKNTELISQIPVVINIDHHVTNTNFGDLQYVDKDACATAAIVYRIIEVMGLPIEKPVAYAIYTGILTDTGSFRFANTNRDSFGICAEMVSHGVNPEIVSQHVFGTYSLGRIKLLNMALDSIEISENGKLSMMILSESMLVKSDTQSEDVAGFINYAKNIQNVVVAVLVFEYPQNGNSTGDDDRRLYHISLRSDGTVDVGKIAVSFKGGGHVNAAGFDIKSSLPELKTLIFDLSGRL